MHLSPVKSNVEVGNILSKVIVYFVFSLHQYCQYQSFFELASHWLLNYKKATFYWALQGVDKILVGATVYWNVSYLQIKFRFYAPRSNTWRYIDLIDSFTALASQ